MIEKPEVEDATPNVEIPWARDAFGLEARLIRDAHRTDFDVGRVYRLTSAATFVGAALAVFGALSDDDLAPWERVISAAMGVAYAGLGVLGAALGPSQVALWFQRRPRRALLVSSAPLAVMPLTGGTRSPLKRLATIGVATGAGVRERRRDAQLHGLSCGMVYAALARLSPRARRVGLLDAAATTVGFVLAGRMAATASQVAYDNRCMFDQLFEFTYERDDMQPFVDALARVLKVQREALLDAARCGTVPGVSSDEFREILLTSLGRLEERLGVMDVAARSNFQLQPMVLAMRPHMLRRGGNGALQAAVATNADELRTFVRARAQLILDLIDDPPERTYAIDDNVEIDGLARLALIGAIVTGATTNVLRHAPTTQRLEIRIRRTGEHVEIEIVNDGVPDTTDPPARRSQSGLVHLQRKLQDFGGGLTFGPRATGGFRVHAWLPADEESDQTQFWETDIRREIADSVAVGARLAALKSTLTAAASAWEGRRHGRRHLGLLAAHTALPAVGELVLASATGRRRRAETQTEILVTVATLNFCSALRGACLSTTWVNGFASRWALAGADDPGTRHAVAARAERRGRAYILTALNLLAILPAARDGRHYVAEHAVSIGLGPALVGLVVNQSLPRTGMIDVAGNDRLAEVESLHQLADSFHAEHAAPPKLREVANLVNDESIKRRLLASLDDAAEAEQALRFPRPDRELPSPVRSGEPLARLGEWLKHPRSPVREHAIVTKIWPEPQSHHRETVGVPYGVRLGEYLAHALARRVWPARVRLEFDDNTLGYAPSASIDSARFRRKAVQAMDLVGRKLNWDFGRRWDGTWILGQVDLRVLVIPWTGTLECQLTMWAPAPTPARRAVDALHDRIARTPLPRIFNDHDAGFEESLAWLGASLVGGRWNIYHPSELRAEPSILLPTGAGERAVCRGDATVRLHPQRYASVASALSLVTASIS